MFQIKSKNTDVRILSMIRAKGIYRLAQSAQHREVHGGVRVAQNRVDLGLTPSATNPFPRTCHY